jgi:hypothetical protein
MEKEVKTIYHSMIREKFLNQICEEETSTFNIPINYARSKSSTVNRKWSGNHFNIPENYEFLNSKENRKSTSQIDEQIVTEPKEEKVLVLYSLTLKFPLETGKSTKSSKKFSPKISHFPRIFQQNMYHENFISQFFTQIFFLFYFILFSSCMKGKQEEQVFP